ncbi:hypothetical protein PGTUg99_028149 [Puccinia graminis f. sp. tritici]|uniref:Uncharacterized protein n=1 Tax=Puccinia graminis f. sp. tritici TaxID=56615 RepID=A0A5B0N0A4_PUCGR|nr:hypothetical protein PGTUg99_028149 [Puccinia graminis f. sp. tritici]
MTMVYDAIAGWGPHIFSLWIEFLWRIVEDMLDRRLELRCWLNLTAAFPAVSKTWAARYIFPSSNQKTAEPPQWGTGCEHPCAISHYNNLKAGPKGSAQDPTELSTDEEFLPLDLSLITSVLTEWMDSRPIRTGKDRYVISVALGLLESQSSQRLSAVNLRFSLSSKGTLLQIHTLISLTLSGRVIPA